jgi:hypothetical protein
MIITNNEKIYRCIRLPDNVLRLGEWEILYDGRWLKVRNYEIRKKLYELFRLRLTGCAQAQN